MKTFLLVATVLVFGCIASGVGMHYYDNLYFEVHFGFPLSDALQAEEDCERDSKEDCVGVGYFIPKSKIPHNESSTKGMI